MHYIVYYRFAISAKKTIYSSPKLSSVTTTEGILCR